MQQKTVKTVAVLAARLTGMMLLVAGLWQAAGNVLGTVTEFDPAYLAYYFQSQLLRPLLGCFLGIFIWLLGKPLGSLLARGLGEKDALILPHLAAKAEKAEKSSEPKPDQRPPPKP